MVMGFILNCWLRLAECKVLYQLYWRWCLGNVEVTLEPLWMVDKDTTNSVEPGLELSCPYFCDHSPYLKLFKISIWSTIYNLMHTAGFGTKVSFGHLTRDLQRKYSRIVWEILIFSPQCQQRWYGNFVQQWSFFEILYLIYIISASYFLIIGPIKRRYVQPPWPT